MTLKNNNYLFMWPLKVKIRWIIYIRNKNILKEYLVTYLMIESINF